MLNFKTLPYETFCLGQLSEPYCGTEICSNFPCVDIGFSFGIGLCKPRLNDCTLNFENSHVYISFPCLLRMVFYKFKNSGYNLGRNDGSLSEANSRLKTWYKN